MESLNILKQVVQIAFSSGKISNIEEIKAIVIAIDTLENILAKVNTETPPVIN
jgi:hypothetical protein